MAAPVLGCFRTLNYRAGLLPNGHFRRPRGTRSGERYRATARAGAGLWRGSPPGYYSIPFAPRVGRASYQIQ
jgi:hypothetical protein